MSQHLARNIYHLMRGAARRTSVDSLRRQGRKTVSVLNFRDIQELIESAVENTLRRRGLSLDGPEIHEEVRLEFLALIRERDLLRNTIEDLLAQKQTLEDNRGKLDQALVRATTEYEQARAELDGDDLDDLQRLSDKLEGGLRDLLDAGGAAGALRERVLAMVRQATDEQRDLTLSRSKATHEAHVRRLQRRMNRLKQKLSETEEMLERAREEPEMVGVPGQPIVNGLTTKDAAYETKRELLGEIFRLNVELREMLDK